MCALGRRGVSVHLLARRLGPDALPGMEKVRVHRLPRARRPGRDEQGSPEPDLNSVLRSELANLGEVDLVYERFSLGSFGALEHARAAGIPAILEVNGPRVEKAAARGALADLEGAEDAAARAVGAATAVVAVSEGVAEHVRGAYGAGSRVHVIQNGVDPGRFPGSLIHEREVSVRPFTVGFVGTFKPHHGLEHLVEAFLRLRRTEPDTRLLMVGDGAERAAVQERLSDLCASGHVDLPGAVPPSEVGGVLSRMDVGVAPYPARRSYVSPLKVFEYMAAGLPVVASGVDQIVGLVEDEETGLLCGPEDPEGLAAALGRLAADPALRSRLGRRGRERVLAEHTWDAVAGRILALAGA